MEDKLLLFQFVIIGVGVLLPWNAILTALDWFDTRFSGYNASFVFTIMNFIPYTFMQPLTIWKGNNYSYNKRIAFPFVASAGALALSPFIAVLLPGLAGFILTCILVFLIGVIIAVAQTSVFGLAGVMPFKYTNAVMVGNGLAGVSINVARLICLASFPGDDTGLLISTIVYFAISGGVLIFCTVTQLRLMTNTQVQEAVAKTKGLDGHQIRHRDGSELDTFIDDVIKPIQESTSVEIVPFKKILRSIWQYLFMVYMCYVITFGVFPGVSLANNSPDLPFVWFAVLLITTFNVFDFIGRNSPALWLPSTPVLWVLTFSRFIFWFTFIMIASDHPHQDPHWLFGATWFKFVNMAIFAFSNGFTSTSHMIYGPQQVIPGVRDVAGYTMATGLVFGIFSGSLVALSFTGVGHMPSDQ